MVEVSDEQMDSIEASFKAAVAIKDERDRLREANRELLEALTDELTLAAEAIDAVIAHRPEVSDSAPTNVALDAIRNRCRAALAKHGVK